MKKVSILIFAIISLFRSQDILAQNQPTGDYFNNDNSIPPHVVPRPANFSTVTPAWPTNQTFNYTRLFKPTEAVTALSSQTKMSISTTYKDGWGRAMQQVTQLHPSQKPIYTPIDLRASRTSVDYLPYVKSGTNGKFRKDAYTEQRDYYATHPYYQGEGETGYNKTVTSNTNGNPTIATAAPGRKFTGENRGTSTQAHVLGSGELPSDLNQVYKLSFNASTNQVCRNGNYAIGELTVKWARGEHQSELAEYMDKSGKLICKRSINPDGGYLTTYYVYNDLGRLTNIVPPAQAQTLISNSCIAIIAGNVNNIYTNSYNEYGQVTGTRIPGKEGIERIVYDKYNRVFLTQSAVMADAGKAYFTLYDKQGRVVITGIFNETQNMNQSYYNGIIAGTTAIPAYTHGGTSVPNDDKLEYWLRNDMPVNVYPVDGSGEHFLAGCEIHTLNYYDRYDIAPANEVNYSSTYNIRFQEAGFTATPKPYMLAQGKLVATKTRILDNGNVHNWGTRKWVTSVNFYDEQGQVIQTHTFNPWQNVFEGTWDITTTLYNFNGQPLLTVFDHKGTGKGNRPTGALVQVKKTYETHSGRLRQTEHRIGIPVNNPWYVLNTYTYDDLGRVLEKSLGNVEYQDYTYNIRGQLKGINELDVLVGRPSTASKRTYASMLQYEFGFDNPRYDGKLSGYLWTNAGTADVKAYGYDYDDAGRMTRADYRYSNNGLGGWMHTAKDYTTSDLSYDRNGNMQTMKQMGENSMMNGVTMIDNLQYQYDVSGTRLSKVTDSGNPSSPRINDFSDGVNPGSDYEYNKDGNLRVDHNRGITNMLYNHAGQVTEIVKGTNGNIKNIYTADGALLQKVITDNTQTPALITTYHYWGPFVYKNEELEMVMHEEGRARFNNPGYEYDYFVKDHLGNVRTIVKGTMNYAALEYKAGFEMISASVEETIFDQIGQVRNLKPLGSPGNLSSGALEGSDPTRRIGAALLLHAMAGESFNISGYGYYESQDVQQYNMYPMPEYMLESLTDAMIAGAATGIGENGLESTVTLDNLLTSTNYNTYEVLKNAATNTNLPRAYLNYLVFDETFNLQAEHSHVVQISGGASAWHKMDIPGDQVMPINGYILSYFSNESHIPVAVDDLHIINYASTLLEEQHYYPHGVVIESSQPSGSVPENQYLTQGNKLQTELGLNINHFNFRQYDAQIGRFMSVDPLATAGGQEVLNPYQFCFNDPGNFVDPLGLHPDDDLSDLYQYGYVGSLTIITAQKSANFFDAFDADTWPLFMGVKPSNRTQSSGGLGSGGGSGSGRASVSVRKYKNTSGGGGTTLGLPKPMKPTAAQIAEQKRLQEMARVDAMNTQKQKEINSGFDLGNSYDPKFAPLMSDAEGISISTTLGYATISLNIGMFHRTPFIEFSATPTFSGLPMGVSGSVSTFMAFHNSDAKAENNVSNYVGGANFGLGGGWGGTFAYQASWDTKSRQVTYNTYSLGVGGGFYVTPFGYSYGWWPGKK